MYSQTTKYRFKAFRFVPFIAGVGIVIALIWTTGAVSGVQGAAAFVDKLGQQVIAMLSTPADGRDVRIRQFEKLFAENFDVPVIASAVLGRHGRDLSPSQARDYQAVFRDYIVSLYATQFAEYSGQRFSVTDQKSLNEDSSLVSAKILDQAGPEINLGFIVHGSADDSLKIIDVTVEGVSLIVTKRSEFGSVVSRDGLPALTKLLREKTTRMRAAKS